MRYKPFSVYKRKESSVPYIWFKDPVTKTRLSRGRFSAEYLNSLISRPVSKLDEVSIQFIGYSVIQEGLLNGLLKERKTREGARKKEEPLFNDYVLKFWDYENSWYFKKERELRGRKITLSYCKNQKGSFTNHCAPLIPDTLKLKDFTVELMETIQFDMRGKGFSGKTINEATNSITKPLKEAFKRGDLESDIGSKITGVKNDTKERGILTPEESEKVIRSLKESTVPNTFDRWKYLFCAVAYYTGMRQGEILALQNEDLDTENNIIHVNHNWTRQGTLKSPKNGKTRTTFTIDEKLIKELVEYSNLNKKNPFIFSAKQSEGKPLKQNRIDEVFNDTLNEIGISEEERNRRGIVFHSLRHGFITYAQNNGVSKELVEKSAGHSSLKMTEHYTHETEESKKKFREATKEAIKYID